MADNLVIFGQTFNNVAGIKATNTQSNIETFTKGGGTLTIGAIRPDATIAAEWTYDKLIVADEGKTIPAYTTSAATMKAAEDLTTATLDFDNYDYALVYMGLATPVYNTNVIDAGRFVYSFVSYYGEYFEIPSGAIKDGSIAYNTRISTNKSNNYMGVVYNTSSSAISVYAPSSYSNCAGPYLYNAVTSSLSGSSYTPKSPTMYMKGSPTYCSQTYWEAMTDVRYQYIIRMYKVPKGTANIDGYSLKSEAMHIIACFNSNSQTLT